MVLAGDYPQGTLSKCRGTCPLPIYLCTIYCASHPTVLWEEVGRLGSVRSHSTVRWDGNIETGHTKLETRIQVCPFPPM